MKWEILYYWRGMMVLCAVGVGLTWGESTSSRHVEDVVGLLICLAVIDIVKEIRKSKEN